MKITHNCYSPTQIVLPIQSRQKISITISGRIDTCLIRVITPKDSPFHDTNNKKAIGKFKVEASVMPITEFIGL